MLLWKLLFLARFAKYPTLRLVCVTVHANTVYRMQDPVENTIRNLEALSNHLEAVAMAKAQEIMEQRQKIESILHSILPK